MKSTPSAEMLVIHELLDNGPTTVRNLIPRLGRAESTICEAMQRLQRQRMVRVIGNADRRPGSNAPRARIFDLGPRVLAWHARNVKPKED